MTSSRYSCNTPLKFVIAEMDYGAADVHENTDNLSNLRIVRNNPIESQNIFETKEKNNSVNHPDSPAVTSVERLPSITKGKKKKTHVDQKVRKHEEKRRNEKLKEIEEECKMIRKLIKETILEVQTENKILIETTNEIRQLNLLFHEKIKNVKR